MTISALIHFILRHYIIRKHLSHVIFRETEIKLWWKEITGVYGPGRCVMLKKADFAAGRGRVRLSQK